MSKFYASCDLAGLTTNPDNTLSCSTGWEIRETMFPLYELTTDELTLIMSGIFAFFAACAMVNRIVKSAASAGGTDQ